MNKTDIMAIQSDGLLFMCLSQIIEIAYTFLVE